MDLNELAEAAAGDEVIADGVGPDGLDLDDGVSLG